MASRNLFKTQKTLIVPYGLRSWLGCVCRAVLLEDPENVIDFIFDYCMGLLNFRSQNQSMDVKDLTYLYQKNREKLAAESQREEHDEAKAVDQVHLEDSQTVSRHESPTSPITGEEQAPGSPIQSAVFQRAPPGDDIIDTEHYVVLENVTVPSEDVIIVHSESLPEAIVFQEKDYPAEDTLPTTSLERIPFVPQPTVVVFHKVPSVEEVLQVPQSVETISAETREEAETPVEVPISEEGVENAVKTPEEVTSPVIPPKAAVVSGELQEVKPISPRPSAGNIPPEDRPAEVVPDKRDFSRVPSSGKPPEISPIAVDVPQERLAEDMDQISSLGVKISEEAAFEETVIGADHTVFSAVMSNVEEAERISEEAPQRISYPEKHPILQEAERMTEKIASLRTALSPEKAEEMQEEPEKITSPEKPPSLDEDEGMPEEALQKIPSPRTSPLLEETEKIEEALQKIPSPRPSPLLEETEEIEEALQKIPSPRTSPLLEETEKIEEALQKIPSPRPSPLLEEIEEMEETLQKIPSPRTSPLLEESEKIEEALQKIPSPRPSLLLEETEEMEEALQKIPSPRTYPLPEETEGLEEALQKMPSPRTSPLPEETEGIEEALQKMPSPRTSPLPVGTGGIEEALQKIPSPRPSPLLEETEETEKAQQKITSPRTSPLPKETEEMEARQKITSPKLSPKPSFALGEFQETKYVSPKPSTGKISSEEITPEEVVSEEGLPHEALQKEKPCSPYIFKDIVQACLKEVADTIRHSRNHIGEKGPSEIADVGEEPGKLSTSQEEAVGREAEVPEEITPKTALELSTVSGDFQESQVDSLTISSVEVFLVAVKDSEVTSSVDAPPVSTVEVHIRAAKDETRDEVSEGAPYESAAVQETEEEGVGKEVQTEEAAYPAVSPEPSFTPAVSILGEVETIEEPTDRSQKVSSPEIAPIPPYVSVPKEDDEVPLDVPCSPILVRVPSPLPADSFVDKASGQEVSEGKPFLKEQAQPPPLVEYVTQATLDQVTEKISYERHDISIRAIPDTGISLPGEEPDQMTPGMDQVLFAPVVQEPVELRLAKPEKEPKRISFSWDSISERAPSKSAELKSSLRLSAIQTIQIPCQAEDVRSPHFSPKILPVAGREPTEDELPRTEEHVCTGLSPQFLPLDDLSPDLSDEQREELRSSDQDIPTEATQTTRAESVPETPISQVWILYHLAHVTDEGTLSTKVLSQPPFNGCAYIRMFGPGHVLLAERSSPHPPPDIEPVRGCLSPGGSFVSAPSQPASTDPSRPGMSIPNYFLSLEDNLDNEAQNSVTARTSSRMLCQVLSNTGSMVYSPAIFHSVTLTTPMDGQAVKSKPYSTSAPVIL